MKILIVDECGASRQQLKRIFENEGHEVREAANCQEAFKMLVNDGFAFIISEILPPVMTGFQFCLKCKNDEKIKKIPFFFYTNAPKDNDFEQYAFTIGADGYVRKGESEAELTRIMLDITKKIDQGLIQIRQPGAEVSTDLIRSFSSDLVRRMEDVSTRYKALFEYAGDGIMILQDYRFVECNNRANQIFNGRPEQIIGRFPYELSPACQPDGADSREKALALMDAALAGKPMFFEWQHRRCDGSLFDAEVSLRRLSLPTGVLLLAVVRDITERKKIQTEIMLNEEIFRAVFETAHDVIFIKDHALRYLRVNTAMSRLFNTVPEKIIGFTDADFFDPETARAIADEDRRVLEGEIIESDPLKIIAGIPRKFHTIKVPLRDRHGRIWGLCGITRDRTEHERIINNLRKNEELLRQITDNVSEVIFTLDLDWRFTYVSPSVQKITGYTAEDFLVLRPDQLLTEESLMQVMKIFQQALAASGRELTRSVLLVLENIKKDGSRYWTETTFKFLLDAEQRPVSILGVSRDLSEIRKVNQELKKSYEKLSEILQGTVLALSSAVEKRDPYTAGHQRRVAQLSCALAREMGLSEDVINYLNIAATLHDVGKLYIPAEILAKPTKLTPPEFEIIKTHSRAGFEILKPINFPWPVAQIVLQHHEKNDGSGYPDGLTGDQILLEAKILSVADIVEAMMSHRPYREALGLEQALGDLNRGRDRLFDARIVDTCVRLFKDQNFSFQ